MKNIKDICAEFGVEIPADKATDFEKSVNENYKTIAEFEKKVSKLEAERDNANSQLKTANETLEKFKDVKPEEMTAEIEKYKKQAKDLEDDYNKKLYERDFADALNKAIEGYKFTSNAAKESVLADIKNNSELTLKNGKIYGVDEYVKDLKEKDPSAFVTEKDEHKAKFTAGSKGSDGKKPMTKDEIMQIKDTSERQAAIAANLSLFDYGK